MTYRSRKQGNKQSKIHKTLFLGREIKKYARLKTETWKPAGKQQTLKTGNMKYSNRKLGHTENDRKNKSNAETRNFENITEY